MALRKAFGDSRAGQRVLFSSKYFRSYLRSHEIPSKCPYRCSSF